MVASTAISSVANLAGGLIGNKSPSAKDYSKMAMEELAVKKHTAKTLPTWIKKGWEKAGIHPIYGMGGNSAQFSPSVSIGGGDNGSMGQAIANMGQNISRGVEAYATEQQKLSNRLLETQVEGQELDNAKKASDLSLLNHAKTPGLNANPIDHGQLVRNKDNSLTMVPSEEISDRIDAMGEIGGIPMAVEWYIRNKIPFHRDQLKSYARKKQTAHGRANNARRGINKFTHMAKTLYNRYAR